MAEVGLIASVVGIASAGVKLSVTLYTFSESVSSADKSIRDVANDVSLTSSVLEELGSNLKKDNHSRTYSDRGLKTAEKIVSECSNVFKDIDEALGKSISRVTDGSLGNHTRRSLTFSALEKLKWPFREPKMKLLRSNLDRLKSTLILLLNVLTYARKLKTEESKASSHDYDRHLIETLVRSNQEATRKYEELKRSLLPTRNSSQEAGTLLAPRNGPAPPQCNLGATEEHLVLGTNPSTFPCLSVVPLNEKPRKSIPQNNCASISNELPADPTNGLHTQKIGLPSSGLSADELTAFVGHITKLVERLEVAQSTLQKQRSSFNQGVESTAYSVYYSTCVPVRPGYKIDATAAPSLTERERPEERHQLSSQWQNAVNQGSSRDIENANGEIPMALPMDKEGSAGHLNPGRSSFIAQSDTTPREVSGRIGMSGCLVCRKRRIKCGEDRNCIKSRRTCNGYAQRIMFKYPMNAFKNDGFNLNAHDRSKSVDESETGLAETEGQYGNRQILEKPLLPSSERKAEDGAQTPVPNASLPEQTALDSMSLPFCGYQYTRFTPRTAVHPGASNPDPSSSSSTFRGTKRLRNRWAEPISTRNGNSASTVSNSRVNSADLTKDPLYNEYECGSYLPSDLDTPVQTRLSHVYDHLVQGNPQAMIYDQFVQGNLQATISDNQPSCLEGPNIVPRQQASRASTPTSEQDDDMILDGSLSSDHVVDRLLLQWTILS